MVSSSGVAIEIMIMSVVLSLVLLFLGIGVSVLIHLCIVGRASRRGLINNTTTIDQTGTHSGRRRTSSMSQDDLEKLPCYDYESKGQDSSIPVPDCAVCLENFKEGDKCRLLPTCNHSFHAQCVDAWLVKTPICPICRTNAADSRGSGLVTSEQIGHANDNFATRVEMRGSYTNDNSHFNDVNVDTA